VGVLVKMMSLPMPRITIRKKNLITSRRYYWQRNVFRSLTAKWKVQH
jgi:hypothetical protein